MSIVCTSVQCQLLAKKFGLFGRKIRPSYKGNKGRKETGNSVKQCETALSLVPDYPLNLCISNIYIMNSTRVWENRRW